jgi:peptide/nickel transport system permease protein
MKRMILVLKQTYHWIGLSGFGLCAIVLVVLASPWLVAHDPLHVDMSMRLHPPEAAHWLGTDGLGRDLLSRLLTGGRITLGASLAVLLGALLIGIPIGLLSGYAGGWLDRAFMRVADAFLAFPDFLVAIVLSGLLGPHIANLILAIMAVKWISYARIVRNTVRVERSKDYIAIAQMNGVRPILLMRKHLLPHALSHVIALAALDIGKIILMIASLSYVGLGVQPPGAEWGALLNEGRAFFLQSPYLMIWPGLAIMLTVMLANLIGDRIQERLGHVDREGVA